MQTLPVPLITSHWQHAKSEIVTENGMVVARSELAARAGVFPALRDSWLERAMEVFRFVGLARRVRMVRRSWRLFRQASNFAAIVTPGDLEGLTVAALEGPRGRKRPIHVVYDCISYGGGRLRRAWVQNKEGA